MSPLSSFQREHDYAGYINIANNMPLFHAINCFPIPLNLARLDEGGGIEEKLMRNRAKYHQSCRLLFNNTKLQRAQKRATASTSTCREGNRSKRQRKSDPPKPSSVCFLCEEEAETPTLRQAITMQLNERLNECARTLNDGMLLAKLRAGDVVELELKYHPACLVAVYNRERAHHYLIKQEQSCKKPGKEVYPIGFSELILYITDTRAVTEGTDPVIFSLADLATLYKQRLEQLGVDSPYGNSARLEEHLLSHIPELETHQKGRDVLIAFKNDIGSIFADGSKYGEPIQLS